MVITRLIDYVTRVRVGDQRLQLDSTLARKAGNIYEMAHLSFSLSPDALVRLHDVLTCLGKFDESVALEAEYDLVSLLNHLHLA